jgi:hypothetical protein
VVCHGLQEFQEGVPAPPQTVAHFTSPHIANQTIAALNITWDGTTTCMVMDNVRFDCLRLSLAVPWRGEWRRLRSAA